MSLTPEQREAAIQKMCHGMSGGLVGPPYHRLTISDANAALNALLENHVVLHRDDVTEEYGAEHPSPLYLPDGDTTAFILDGTFTYRELAEAFVRQSAPYSRVVSRKVTRWEPIDKEDNRGS